MEKEENQGLKQPEIRPSHEDKDQVFQHRISHNKALIGLFIVVIGIVLLLRQIPPFNDYMPDWLFTWPMILIIIGAFIFLKNGFGGLPPIIIGIFFLLRDEDVLTEQFRNYAFPLLIILIGLIFILKRNHHPRLRQHQLRRRLRRQGRYQKGCIMEDCEYTDNSSEDYLDVNSVFGSAEKSMFTKTFKGGNINCAFGGSKINLTQADIEERATLNISVAFGGAEITVPANWQIQNELTAILGGIEDKRRLMATVDTKKTLILRGGIFCGGVEIKN
ncbi:MAG TPA: DUF5668 domain-containing protein [Arachidicoccus sp.]|nr:DUF5668 domain-containing protein [Arachidicoccus sp.]